MRTNVVRPEKVAKGYHSKDCVAKRVVAFLDEETFALVRERAVERGVGVSAIVREAIDAGLLKKVLPHS